MYSGPTGPVSDRASAVYKQVCMDVDGLWWTGCEVALLYNLRSTTEGPAKTVTMKGDDGLTYTLRGVYDRSIGVRPYYDKNFQVIDWTLGGTLSDTVSAGFDCEILRALPREFTHITPQTYENTIECDPTIGRCKFTCDTAWRDCDGNPWNGCETSTLLCGGGTTASCQAAQRYSVAFNCASQLATNELDKPAFCDGGRVPYDEWRASWAQDATDAGVFTAYTSIHFITNKSQTPHLNAHYPQLYDITLDKPIPLT